MSHTPKVVTEYLGDLLDPVKRGAVIDRCIADIKRSGVEFEAIAFTGVSGALIAPVLAHALGKSLIVVRKPGQSSHSNLKVEGDAAAQKYIIADDIVDSGKTIFNIVSSVAEWADTYAFDHTTHEYKYIRTAERTCVGVIAVKPYQYSKEFAYTVWNSDSGGPRTTRYYRNLAFREEAQ